MKWVKKKKTNFTEGQILNRVLRFLSFRPRSEKEIKDYLNRLKIIIELRQKIIDKLKKLDLINDEKFTSWWIEQRNNLNPKGKRILISELRQKGIDQQIIDAQIQKISQTSQEQLALAIVRKKKKLYSSLPKLKLKNHLFSHLIRRGFDFELAQCVIDEALKKE